MYHYTYLLQSQADDMMYIGVRSCQGTPEADNYWGSSKHLPKNVSEVCDKFILGTFDSRVEAVADEIRRHTINDVVVSDIFWNRAKQTSTGFDRTGATQEAWNKGIKHTDETKQKISESSRRVIADLKAKGKDHWLKGKTSSFKGMQHSEEAKVKLSASNKGKHNSTTTEFKKGHLTGKCWFNNGNYENLYIPGQEPEGFTKGRRKWQN